MLGKVFKSVFLQAGRKLGAASLLFAVISILSALMTNVTGPLAVVSMILRTSVVILGVVMVFYALLVCWIFFKNSFYQDQAFLYQTLPVKRKTLFYGELLAFVCWFLIVYVVLLFGLWYGLMNTEFRESALSLFSDVLPAVLGSKSAAVWMVVLFLLVCFEQLLCEAMAGIFGLCVGYSSLKDKLAKSILTGIFAYYGLAAIMLGILFLVARTNPDMWAMLDTGEITSEALPLMGWLFGLYVPAIAVLVAACHFRLKKGINID